VVATVGDERSESESLIELVSYRSEWADMFAAERTVLQGVIEPWLAEEIEHVGSTAIPGMMAKPIIDIMAPVESLEASMDAIQALAEIDYNYWPYKADEMHWFCKPSPYHRTHHLHLVPLESSLWLERLRFRDALRNDEALRSEYSELKEGLAARFHSNREAYTEAKGEFVLRVSAVRDADR